mmetsp:Transcript_6701/g.16238  ORF Transcript_6701/g.16238 Transcript_6701/m.16238 type:complete len:414 (+) Transcript_6701:4997-6238(+)
MGVQRLHRPRVKEGAREQHAVGPLDELDQLALVVERREGVLDALAALSGALGLDQVVTAVADDRVGQTDERLAAMRIDLMHRQSQLREEDVPQPEQAVVGQYAGVEAHEGGVEEVHQREAQREEAGPDGLRVRRQAALEQEYVAHRAAGGRQGAVRTRHTQLQGLLRQGTGCACCCRCGGCRGHGGVLWLGPVGRELSVERPVAPRHGVDEPEDLFRSQLAALLPLAVRQQHVQRHQSDRLGVLDGQPAERHVVAAAVVLSVAGVGTVAECDERRADLLHFGEDCAEVLLVLSQARRLPARHLSDVLEQLPLIGGVGALPLMKRLPIHLLLVRRRLRSQDPQLQPQGAPHLWREPPVIQRFQCFELRLGSEAGVEPLHPQLSEVCERLVAEGRDCGRQFFLLAVGVPAGDHLL